MLAGNQLRPLLLELVSGAYRLADAVTSRLAMGGEHLDDLLAEAKSGARDRTAGRARKQRRRAVRRVPSPKSGRTLRAVTV